MLKYIFLILNFLILFLSPNLQTDGVSVSSNLPSSAKPGSSFTVEVTIKKGATSGFAKLQQELPAGLTASAAEGKGGTFTFVDQKVKFVWVSLPADAEFQVSYKVNVATDASGSMSFGGTFSYLENNESRKYNITPGTINITSDEPIAAAEPAPAPAPEPPAPAPVTPPAPTPTPEAPVASVPPATQQPAIADKPATGQAPSATSTSPSQMTASGILITRSMPGSVPAQQTEFVVELTIKKPDISGFAKIQENLPEGFTASAIEAKGATFTFAEQKAKFVWMSLPPGEEFKISYKISLASGLEGTKSIDGVFSYLENSDSKKYTISESTILIGAGSGATAQNNVPAKEETPENITSQSTPAPQAATPSAPQAEPSRSIARIPAPVSGIEYKIQVSAAKKEIPNPNDFFRTKYSFAAGINQEMHEGWHKYTSGSFAYYVGARDYRNEAWSKGINGSFVVAYNSGTRITVQEALLITKQKWVQ